jgi:hypothetical protein
MSLPTDRIKKNMSYGRNAVVLTLAIAAGCDTATVQHRGRERILSGFEMDQVTAGSASAAADAAARGLGYAPHTTVLGFASAYSDSVPIASAPILDSASSQVVASASAGNLAQTNLSSQISVNGANGGVSIEARAVGTGTSQAQVTAQLYGVSTNRSDLVFGSIAAVGCCGSGAAARVNVDSKTGGPYSRELLGAPVFESPGQVQSRIDIAVVSSTMPLLDPAQVLVAGAPASVSPKY